MQQLHEHAAPGVLPERKSGGGWELTCHSSFVDIGSGYGKVRASPPSLAVSCRRPSADAARPTGTESTSTAAARRMSPPLQHPHHPHHNTAVNLVGCGCGRTGGLQVVVHAGVGLPGVRAHGIEYVASRAQVAAAALAQLRGQGAAAALALSGVSLACGDATVDLGASIAFSHVYIYDKVPGPLDSASRCTHTVPRWYKIASRLNGEATFQCPYENGEATLKSDLLDALLWFHNGFLSTSLFSRRVAELPRALLGTLPLPLPVGPAPITNPSIDRGASCARRCLRTQLSSGWPLC